MFVSCSFSCPIILTNNNSQMLWCKMKSPDFGPNTLILRCTSLLFIIPIFCIAYFREPCTYEIVLGILLIICILFSQLFWNYPIRNSYIHTIDSVFAKITIAAFMVYTLYLRSQKNDEIELFWLYLELIMIIVGCAFMSDYHSSRQWCSDKHIFYHGFLHYFCMIGACFVIL